MADDHKLLKNQTGQEIKEQLRAIRNVLAWNGKGVIYGFHIDATESDPEDAVTYLKDAVGMTPAHMDFDNDVFKWGSWRDAFFMPRPCMVKYDGTVDYYLDENDYAKKYDGTPSDIANDAYAGNAMMEWGQDGKIIWYKVVPDATPTSASVYIADYQADDDYHCWSFINNQGNIVDHFYTPIYNGSIDGGGRLRSISGKGYAALCQSKTAAQELAAAELNNPGSDKLWLTEVYADVTLINLLLILISKSLDSQTAFGQGRCGQASAAANMLSTGTMNNKGLFWGSSNVANGVKVFGMENWWGNQWRRYLGHISNDRVQKYKLTYGREDGSTSDGYATSTSATDYAGYLTGATAPDNNNYAKTMGFSANGVFQNKENQDSSAFYWCDYCYQNTGLRCALRGGNCNNSAGTVGFVIVALTNAPSNASWNFGAAPSLKPLSREGELGVPEGTDKRGTLPPG